MNERQILEQSIADHQQAIDKAKAKLAEESKPRNGDYNVKTGKMAYAISDKGVCREPMWRDSNRTWWNGYDDLTPDGNIFDDLKALQEDVTEFEITDEFNDKLIVSIDNGAIHFKIKPVSKFERDCMRFEGEAKADLILKLRQMEATLRRQDA